LVLARVAAGLRRHSVKVVAAARTFLLDLVYGDFSTEAYWAPSRTILGHTVRWPSGNA
jgi:hypothetical protein